MGRGVDEVRRPRGVGNGRREVNAMEAPWMFGWLRGESVGFEQAVG